MVGHQAKRENVPAILSGHALEGSEPRGAIVIVEVEGLAVVAAGPDVVDASWLDVTSLPSHEKTVRAPAT